MFAVFGVSMDGARIQAMKKVTPYPPGRALSATEYREAVEREAEKIFAGMSANQLSPTYSNLAEAKQYREMAAKSNAFRSLFIRQRKQHLDGDGMPLMAGKTKRPATYWEDVT